MSHSFFFGSSVRKLACVQLASCLGMALRQARRTLRSSDETVGEGLPSRFEERPHSTIFRRGKYGVYVQS